MEGDVKFYNRKKGFGFIKGDDDMDYFVHFTALPRGTFLRDNDRVSFDPAEGERGPKAENVQLLEKGSDRPEGEGVSQEETTEDAAPAEETPAEEPAQEEEDAAPAEETPAEEPAQEEEEAPAEEEPKEE